MRKIIILLISILTINTSYAFMQWEYFDDGSFSRSPTPEGWFVKYNYRPSPSITFVYDPKHKWKI